jgi:hypothetical protein
MTKIDFITNLIKITIFIIQIKRANVYLLLNFNRVNGRSKLLLRIIQTIHSKCRFNHISKRTYNGKRRTGSKSNKTRSKKIFSKIYTKNYLAKFKIRFKR